MSSEKRVQTTANGLKWIALLCFALSVCFGSNISTANLGSPSGTYFTASGTINDNQKADETDGMIAQGFFSDGSLYSCVFAGGICTASSAPISGSGLTYAGGAFVVEISPPNSNSSSANWNLYNHNDASGVVLNAVTFYGATQVGSSRVSPGGDYDPYAEYTNFGQQILLATAFNPCLSSGVPVTSNGGCQGLTNGFGNAESVSTVSGGLNNSASVKYYNPVHLGQDSPLNDVFLTIVLDFRALGSSTFAGDGLTGVNGSNYFRFGTDTDQIPIITADVPEPATLSMVGLALAALGALRYRRKA